MPDSAQQSMNTLTAQWYNAVTTGLNLDPSTFQLIQSNAPLGTTSPQLWAYFDALPPLSVTNFFNPSQFSSFAQNYGAVVMNLVPGNSTTWLRLMGDYYTKWIAYLQTSPQIPTGGMVALFSNWAMLNLPNPSTAQAAITAYKQTFNSAIGVAVNMYANALAAGGGFAYSNTYENLTAQLPSSPSGSVVMDSATTSSDISQSWAQGQVQGAYDIFWGQASASYDALTQQFAGAQVQVNASFQRVMQFAAGPLAQPSQDPILSGYTPWYNSAALGIAYQTSDNTVWNNTPPTWQSTFGQNGTLQRVCSALIVVDGIDITITSGAQFSSSEQQSFSSAASGGVWPFFAVSGSGGWSSNVSFSDAGEVTVTSSLPAGNPQILGCVVTPISAVLANQQVVQQTARLEAAALLAR